MTNRTTRGRKHTLAQAAFDLYLSGQSERDAVDNTIGGKRIGAADREDIERELRGMIDAVPAESPGLAVVPDDDGSVEATHDAGPIVAPPGAAERDAAVERIASGSSTKPERTKGVRRSLAQRRADAAAAVEVAERAVTKARDALRAVDLLELADLLADNRRGVAAARMIRASVRSGIVDQAMGYMVAGADAVGLTLDPEADSGKALADLIDALSSRAND